MSLKRTKSKTPVKRTTKPIPKSPKESKAVVAQGVDTLHVTYGTLPSNIIALPTPALLAERQQADDLIKQLTDTLPAKLLDETMMGQASEQLIISRKLRKAFEEMIKEKKKPFDEVIDGIKNDYSPYVVRLKGAEDKINLLLQDYRAEATRKQQLEDQRIADAHRKTMDEARAQGVNPLSIPVPQAAPPPPVGFQTAHGKTTTMRVPRWKCSDPSQVPYEYNGVKLWLLNDAGIGTLRRGAGVEAQSPIPGIEYYYDETTVVK